MAKKQESVETVELLSRDPRSKPSVQGLNPIVPVADRGPVYPSFLTYDEVEALGVLNVTGVLHPAPFEDYILKVQNGCQSLVVKGQNPDLIGFEDLNVAFVSTKVDPSNKPPKKVGPIMVAQSKTMPAQWTEVKVYPTEGEVSDSRFYENVARDLIIYCPVKR